MDLELNREHISCYDMVLNTRICQEETLETIVPDACPDILRIVDAGGQICLTGKEVHDGGACVTGTVNGWLLYQPEGDLSVCRMEVKLPFSIRGEASELLSQGRCAAQPFVRKVDARILNPRKVLVRADIGVEMQLFQPRELVLCSGISAQEEAGVQQLTCEHSAYMTAAVQEKEFTIYDEIRLSAGPGGACEILSVCADALCTESKLIGSKLIFKGEAVLRIRYQVEGQLFCMRCPLAFSQIMETPNAGERADCSIQMCVTSLTYVPSDEDGRILNVTLELLGQAVVRDQYPLVLLQDTYSTVCGMVTEQETYTLCQLSEHSMHPQSVRELLDTEDMVKSIIDAGVTVCDLTQTRQDDHLSVGAELQISMLYLDEQDVPRSLSRVITVSGQLDLPPQSSCLLHCRCPGELYASPAAGGVEVRFNLEFHCLITARRPIPVIRNARLDEVQTCEQGEHPSVVLRFAVPGETLWDIAKAYRTTQDNIRQANQLDISDLPAGRMLLIPSSR